MISYIYLEDGIVVTLSSKEAPVQVSGESVSISGSLLDFGTGILHMETMSPAYEELAAMFR